jgi:cytochrome c oxidase subunit IV
MPTLHGFLDIRGLVLFALVNSGLGLVVGIHMRGIDLPRVHVGICVVIPPVLELVVV